MLNLIESWPLNTGFFPCKSVETSRVYTVGDDVVKYTIFVIE